MKKKRSVVEWLERFTSYLSAVGVLCFLYPAGAYVVSGPSAAYWSWLPAWALFALCGGAIWFMRGMKNNIPPEIERMVRGRM